MGSIRNSTRPFFILWAALAAAASAGCGDDSMPSRPQSRPQYAARYAARSLPAAAPLATAPPARRDGADPLAGPDVLEPDPSAPDPLTDAGGQSDASDPFTSSTNPKMPTGHSHWLRGQIFNARVRIRLNGVYLDDFSAPIDQDITMKLHAGVNTVTFSYRPLAAGASAHLELLESEHTPPIPPLATFRSSVSSSLEGIPDRHGRVEAAAQAAQTTTFLAR